MKVYISQSRGKERLIEAFEKAGAEVQKHFSSDVDLVVPTVDQELLILAELKGSLPCKVMVASEFTISICRDKAEFYRFCRRHGFLTPLTMQGDFIVKDRFGSGSRSVKRVSRSQIIQEYVPFQEYSIDYFSDWDSKPLSCIQRQRLNVVNGESQAAKIEWHGLIHETVLRLGRELGLVGHNVIQGWFTGTQFIVGEVNPRFGGGSHFTFDIFDSPRWLVTNGKLHN